MKPEITGAILAGGESRRMGTDKGLIEINGKTLVETAISKLDRFCASKMIITNQQAYEGFGLPCYEDLFPGKGPAGGIHSALSHSQTDWTLVLACDMPNIPEELIQFLIQHIHSEKQAIIPTGLKHIQPLCALYHQSVKNTLENSIKRGELALHKIVRNLKADYLPIDSGLPFYKPDLFLNLNSAVDLENFKTKNEGKG